MQGNLKQIALPEVLQFISMGKSSGKLRVRDPQGNDTTLMIRAGRIINSSALERQRRLGDLLVHRGFLKRSVLARALQVQRTVDPDKKIGEILIERDLIDEGQIREVLRLQLEEEIWNLFALDEGEFAFTQVDDDELGENTVQIDIEPLLLEGSRRQDEWQRIMRLFPNDRLVVGVKAPAPEEGGFPRLSPPEWRVFSQINGRFPICALVNRASMGRFEVYRILADLHEQGLIVIKSEENIAQEVLQQITDLERDTQPNAANKGSVSGFLSRLRAVGGKRDSAASTLDFVSPIGAVSHIINRMVEAFQAQREVASATGTGRTLIEQLWTDLLVSFAKADMVVVTKHRVNTDRLEEFIRLFEFSDPVLDCYEDSIEALLQLMDGLYRIYSQRVGDRTANRLVREILEDAVPKSRYLYVQEFKLDERIQMMLRLPA